MSLRRIQRIRQRNLEKAEGDAGAWDGRGRAGTGTSFPNLPGTSPTPATVRTAARPGQGVGSASPGAPLGPQAASPGGSRAGRFPPAFHPGAEQGAGDVPEAQAPGKAGQERWVRSGTALSNFTQKIPQCYLPAICPHPTSCSNFSSASFPEALRIAPGEEKPKLSLGRQHLAGSEGAQGTVLGSGGRGARCGAPGPLPLKNSASRNPRCPAGKPLWAKRVLPGAASLQVRL